ncbi:porin [Aromatoleum petrolei]|uniref:porin n=1 Tax=Aromatoleum petrolei TaxID=76116 RepID=UPI001FD0CEB4|nr:porin [Aromatoleum petrolei]
MRDDKERGAEASIAYVPFGGLEIELGYVRTRDPDPDPSLWAHGLGVAVKWVPLQAESGLSAGLKYEYERARVDLRGQSDEIARANGVTGLLSWGLASGQHVHLNLGREWVRVEGENEVANTWGVGLEQPLGERLTLAAEVFGAEDARPDRQIGLRYEVVDGFIVSAAVGRGSDRSIANVGCAWEF